MIENAELHLVDRGRKRTTRPSEHCLDTDLSLLHSATYSFFLTGSRYFSPMTSIETPSTDYDFFTSSCLSGAKSQWLRRNGYSPVYAGYDDKSIDRHFRKTTLTRDGVSVNIDVVILKDPRDHIYKSKIQTAIAKNPFLLKLMNDLHKDDRSMVWNSLLEIASNENDETEDDKRLMFLYY